MNVLVLGATSALGESLAVAFADGNALWLCGRRHDRLRAAADACQKAGAVRVSSIAADLAGSAAPIVDAIGDEPVDMVINAASATSRLPDSAIDASLMRQVVASDLLTPLDLVDRLGRHASSRLQVVLISSVLADPLSPSRVIYGSLKRLQEVALQRAEQARPGLDVRVVRVGKVIEVDTRTGDSDRLASAVRQMAAGPRKSLSWGRAGRVRNALFYAQPLAFVGVTRLLRWARGTVGKGRAA